MRALAAGFSLLLALACTRPASTTPVALAALPAPALELSCLPGAIRCTQAAQADTGLSPNGKLTLHGGTTEACVLDAKVTLTVDGVTVEPTTRGELLVIDSCDYNRKCTTTYRCDPAVWSLPTAPSGAMDIVLKDDTRTFRAHLPAVTAARQGQLALPAGTTWTRGAAVQATWSPASDGELTLHASIVGGDERWTLARSDAGAGSWEGTIPTPRGALNGRADISFVAPDGAAFDVCEGFTSCALRLPWISVGTVTLAP